MANESAVKMIAPAALSNTSNVRIRPRRVAPPFSKRSDPSLPKQVFGFAVDSVKAIGVPINHNRKHDLSGRNRVVATSGHTAELVGNGDEALHFAVKLRANFLERGTELQPSLSEKHEIGQPIR